MIDINTIISEGVIYHELGHVLGYILSNHNENTKLGSIQCVEVGVKTNGVTSKESLYHFNNSKKEDREKITENSKNVERTLSWMSMIILGCSSQSVFNSSNVEDCFCDYKPCQGKRDFDTLTNILSYTGYKINFKELIDLLKDELKSFLIENDILNKFKPIVTNIESRLQQSDDNCLKYECKELEELINEIKLKLGSQVFDKYNELISRFSDFIKQKQLNSA